MAQAEMTIQSTSAYRLEELPQITYPSQSEMPFESVCLWSNSRLWVGKVLIGRAQAFHAEGWEIDLRLSQRNDLQKVDTCCYLAWYWASLIG